MLFSFSIVYRESRELEGEACEISLFAKAALGTQPLLFRLVSIEGSSISSPNS